MLIELLIFAGLCLCLYLLVMSSDIFVDNATALGSAFRVSPFLVGFFLVALGTSLAELFSSVVAVIRGSSEFVLGNVVGSNIANIGFILGISVISAHVYRFRFTVDRKSIKQDAFFAGLSLLLLVIIVALGNIGYVHGLILLGFLAIVSYLILTNPSHMPEMSATHFSWKYVALLIFSGIGLYLFAEGTIYTITLLVDRFSFLTDSAFIALTVVAFGTSLPELSVSFSALKKKQFTLILGNVLGSNMFNILLVVGASALFGSLVISHSILFFALPVLIVMTLLMFLFMYTDKKLELWEGVVLLALYCAFIAGLFFV
ncbi:MAG: sodium:calcium antiporter [Candidatus Woesearchaeota archaeon]